MTRQDALDKIEIIDRLGRYCLAVDFRSLDELRDFFADDADIAYDLEAAGATVFAFNGVDEVIAWLASFLTRPGQPERSLTNHVVDVDGDSARSRSYLTAIGAKTTGTFTIGWTRTDAGWRACHFRMRSYATS